MKKYCTCHPGFYEYSDNLNMYLCYHCFLPKQSYKSIKLSKIAKKALRDSHGRFTSNKPLDTSQHIKYDTGTYFEDTSLNGRLEEINNKLNHIIEKLEVKW